VLCLSVHSIHVSKINTTTTTTTPSCAKGSRGDRVFTSSCLCVCLFFHVISKTDAARITKLDTEMFQDESWKPIVWGSKTQRSRSRVTKHCRRGTLHSCECWLLLVDIADSGGGCRRTDGSGCIVCFQPSAAQCCNYADQWHKQHCVNDGGRIL